ncbi:transketolase [Desulforamulus hydrothermalis]|uniref:Putative transketolase N-terminal section n=1 Tax=Desulforamulus hydrothermalis Lam5 = DSM 18033 TaxID=1121428 RepID=K8EFX2_9FIRM|nr:transketolase [Desulforamulus hydrothermalis]CCO07591.1 putative transketolase N-terminal section [Desulforamulus hydrothermalis Lam5 = DSM 18033]SHH20390.1 transketolase [Desulforamulus hydrothermalis Lam5 = DSM 18033]
MEQKISYLQERARAIRRHIITMLGEAGSGHPGGSLSAADIVSVLFFDTMRLDPDNPHWPERDRFVLSKGHAAPVLYAALAEKGFFPPEELLTLRKLGSRLQGHPDMKKLPGVEMSTGSLGQGLSAALGMALGLRLDGGDQRVYALLGDGEVQEGQIWEAAMAAGHFKTDNLTAVLDYNNLQIDGPVDQVMNVAPLADKWRAFNWHVIEIDGHDIPQILQALAEAQQTKGRPTVIIAKTVKGKGVSFMENQVGWHGNAPKPEQVAQALQELA